MIRVKFLIVKKQWLCSKVKSELNTIGYYSLPEESTKDIESFEIAKQFSTIAVIGIGGSSLGAKAVYSFLEPVKELKRELVFLESTDPINIAHLEKGLDIKSTFLLLLVNLELQLKQLHFLNILLIKLQKSNFV